MSEIDCDNVKSAQEISLCSCKRSADTYAELYKVFLRDKRRYDYDKESYTRWKAAHNKWRTSGGVEPERDPENYDKYWLNAPEPVDNSRSPIYNGTCCSMIIDNIRTTGGKVSISDISQSCGNTPAPSNATTPLPKSDSDKKPLITEEQKYMLACAISSCCSLFMVIVILFLVL